MNFLNELKGIIAERDNFRCRRCGIELKQNPFERNIDHIIPRDLIAISEFWNLELLCDNCNEEKGSDLLSDFQERCIRAFMKSFNVEEGLTEHDILKLGLNALFIKHIDYYHNALKEHYQDDYINKQKFGNGYMTIIDLVRNLALKQKPKGEEKIITTEEKLLFHYVDLFSAFLLSSVANKDFYTVTDFWAWSSNNPIRYQNECPRADEILFNYLRSFEYLHNCD